jgi:hypothetical protein
MKAWKNCCLGLVLAGGVAPGAWAQFPPAGAGPGAAAPAPGAPAPAAAPAAAPPGNLLSMLCPTPEQKAACKEALCKTPLGKLLNNGLRPLSALSGGIISPCCDDGINPSDLAKPADSAEGAAARIKAEEADAKARRAAIRYLATVDCHYWPEARDALINALRGDRNECVRWEAAMALGGGCCCNQETIRALAITVSGTEDDGNPSETSERVRGAAAAALDHCLACVNARTVPLVPEVPAEVAPPPRTLQETPPTAPRETPPTRETTPGGLLPPPQPLPGTQPGARGNGQGASDPVTYYRRMRSVPITRVLDDARVVLVRTGYTNPAPDQGGPAASQATSGAPSQPAAPRLPGRSVVELISNAFNPPAKGPAPAPPASVPQAPSAAPLPPETFPPPRVPVGQPPAPAGPVSAAPDNGSIQPVAYRPVVPGGAGVPYAHPYATPALPATDVLAPREVLAPPAPATYYAGRADVQRLVGMLQNDASPAQREWAAVSLAELDWRCHPQVVDVLLRAATRDAAPTVRVECVRALARMDANTMSVVSALQVLQGDRDPRVQREVSQALVKLSGGRPAGPAEAAVLPDTRR